MFIMNSEGRIMNKKEEEINKNREKLFIMNSEEQNMNKKEE